MFKLFFFFFCIKNPRLGDTPGGPVVRNPPSNAGDVGSIPGQGARIPHATGHLGPCATTAEPVHSRARTPQLERLHAATTEPVCSGAHMPQLEKNLHAATKT